MTHHPTTRTTDAAATVARICDEIQRRERFVISSHVRPDGDSIGSQLAMAFALDALGKSVRIVNADPAPDHYQEFPGMERIEIACAEGILAGCRVVDVEANFYDGLMHPVDSKDIAFQVAGYWAFKEAFMKARPCLLEPINLVEVRIPEDCIGKVVGDLSSRRGRILGTDVEGQFQIIRADVPAMELYRYASVLRSLTGGRGVHSEQFSRYEEMPREIEQRVIDEAKKV